MQRTIHTLIAVLFSLLLLADARAEIYPAVVGKTSISIPVPDSFGDGGPTAPALRELGEKMTPTSNRLLAFFVADSEARAPTKETTQALERYFMVQTLRRTEPVDISPKDFLQVRQMLRGQYQSLLVRVVPKAEAELNDRAADIGRSIGVDKLSLKIGEMRGLEIFHDSSSAISLLAVTKYQIQAGGSIREVPMAVGMTTAVLKGKLVYFYAYSRYEQQADLDWVRSVSTDWIPRAEAANQ